jgi:hypothetical protein
VDAPQFFEKFKSIVVDVFENFERVSQEFEGYRQEIFADPAQQERDFLKIAEAIQLDKIQKI